MLCPILSVLRPSPAPPLLLHSLLFCLLISNSTWSAGSRLSERMLPLCSVVYRCFSLNEKDQSAPVSVCIPSSIWGRQQSLKMLPSSCVCVWRSRSDRSTRSNIVYGCLPCRFILCRLALSCGSAFDLNYVRTSCWISVWQKQTWRRTHEDR